MATTDEKMVFRVAIEDSDLAEITAKVAVAAQTGIDQAISRQADLKQQDSGKTTPEGEEEETPESLFAASVNKFTAAVNRLSFIVRRQQSVIPGLAPTSKIAKPPEDPFEDKAKVQVNVAPLAPPRESIAEKTGTPPPGIPGRPETAIPVTPIIKIGDKQKLPDQPKHEPVKKDPVVQPYKTAATPTVQPVIPRIPPSVPVTTPAPIVNVTVQPTPVTVVREGAGSSVVAPSVSNVSSNVGGKSETVRAANVQHIKASIAEGKAPSAGVVAEQLNRASGGNAQSSFFSEGDVSNALGVEPKHLPELIKSGAIERTSSGNYRLPVGAKSSPLPTASPQATPVIPQAVHPASSRPPASQPYPSNPATAAATAIEPHAVESTPQSNPATVAASAVPQVTPVSTPAPTAQPIEVPTTRPV